MATDSATTEQAATKQLETQQQEPRQITTDECLHLDEQTRQDASLRLKSAKGHLEGIGRMLDDPSVYCVDVLKQIKAVQGALTKINEAVLKAHIRDHVATASSRGDTQAIVDELMEALKYKS